MSRLMLFVLLVVLYGTTFLDPSLAKMIGPASSNSVLNANNYQVDFLNVTQFRMLLKFADGSLDTVNVQTFSAISFNEVDNSTGTAVLGGHPVIVHSASLTDPTLKWRENYKLTVLPDQTTIQNVNFTVTLSNGASLTMAHYLYEAATSIVFPEVDYTHHMPPWTYKFAMLVTNWPEPKSNTNLFLFRIDTAAIPYYSPAPVWTVKNHFISVKASWGTPPPKGINATEILNLIDFALIDDTVQYVTWYSEFDRGTNFITEHFPGYKQFYYFPIFHKSFFYDPDLSILVDEGSDTGTDSGSGDGNSTILTAVLVPVLVGGAIVIVALVIVVALVVWWLNRSKILKRLDKVSTLVHSDTSSSSSAPV